MQYITLINGVHAPTLKKIPKTEKYKEKKLTTQVLPAPASLVIGLHPQKGSRSEPQ